MRIFHFTSLLYLFLINIKNDFFNNNIISYFKYHVKQFSIMSINPNKSADFRHLLDYKHTSQENRQAKTESRQSE